MFNAQIYDNRRKKLAEGIDDGLIYLMGNSQVPMNYPSNWLQFRQDSNFLYYSGLDHPDLNLIIDSNSGESTLFADDLSVQDIVWEGERTSVSKMAETAGIQNILPEKELSSYLLNSNSIHYLPMYRQDQEMFLKTLLNGNESGASKSLIMNVIAQRSIKTEDELNEIELALEVTAEMHKLAMRYARDGIS
ncbi:MAG TPA: Xaa-Pro aminopeptidase, partial [Gammaproteobacteria bacterium]|nr:Xaa-Pro aminopeptidase [Gammaproteobacteria bacterium]